MVSMIQPDSLSGQKGVIAVGVDAERQQLIELVRDFAKAEVAPRVR